MVHPVRLGRDREAGDASGTGGAAAFVAAPVEGMPMDVPVLGRRADGLAELLPGLEAAPFECQGAQHLPPRLNQVEVGRVLGLEDELPAGRGTAAVPGA